MNVLETILSFLTTLARIIFMNYDLCSALAVTVQMKPAIVIHLSPAQTPGCR